uniref:Uncharacterized protein n=1 Tax=Knipowitschia caucasica TaxID=637954 RepID=A0AAV2MQP7_KNICA
MHSHQGSSIGSQQMVVVSDRQDLRAERRINIAAWDSSAPASTRMWAEQPYGFSHSADREGIKDTQAKSQRTRRED